jgi:F-type H+-transporting ATPase subunit a
MTPRVFGETTLAHVGAVPVTETMATSAGLSLALVVVGAALARRARTRPTSRAAALARRAYGAIDALVVDTAGVPDPIIVHVATALIAFIAASAIIAQLPWVWAPTANLATTAALALVVFVAVPALGIRRRGLCAYLREYVRPSALFFPMHVVSEISRTLALALRLFGNMMSGHLVVALLVALAGILVPVPLMALDLLIGLLQAYIFTVLACVYLGAALRTGEST